jgi:large subunit ribosomal protein L25
MAMQELTIKRRTETGKEVAKRLRRAGAVPAVVYDGQKAETVTVDPKAVLRMIHGREGTTQLLTLKFDGEAGNGARLAIIRELQFDPVTEQLLHVDLQEVSADRAITVHVTVRPVGEAAGVKEQKGILNLVLYELAISCLPTAIPERIDADVSALMIGDVLKVSDLQAPQGVRILNDPGQAVATVAPPMAEEVVAAAAPTAAAVTEPEVLTERKPKEGEEAAAAGDDKKPAARPARAEKSEKDK